jgi:uncharacterized glyoxalase superfamily protein PhnB
MSTKGADATERHSFRFGRVEDRFGLSWMITLAAPGQK